MRTGYGAQFLANRNVHNSYAPPCKSLYLPTQSAVIGPHRKNHVCLLISCVSLDSNNERRAKKKSSSAMEQLTRSTNEQKPVHHWNAKRNAMQCNAIEQQECPTWEREIEKASENHLIFSTWIINKWMQSWAFFCNRLALIWTFFRVDFCERAMKKIQR